MTLSWLQLSVRTDPSTFDAVSNFLMERGSPGVVIKKSEIQAYFASSGENGSIKKDVRCFLRGISEMHPEAGTASRVVETSKGAKLEQRLAQVLPAPEGW